MDSNPQSLRSSTGQNLKNPRKRKRRLNGPIVYKSNRGNLNIMDAEDETPDEFNGINFTYVKDPISEIIQCSSILIKQKMDSIELITGCETCNKYYIFGLGKRGYKLLFKCEENTDCFMKFFCPTSLKAVNMKLLHISSPETKISNKIVSNIFKPFRCTCFCFYRPVFVLTIEESNEIVGKIIEQYSCCEQIYEVINRQNKVKYIIKGNYTQCGLFCSNAICGKTCDVNLSILSPEKQEPIGNIEKHIIDKEKGEESFQVNFPTEANSNDKLLLLAIGLMINYQYFEIDPSKLRGINNNNLS